MSKHVSRLANRQWVAEKQLRVCAYVRVSTRHEEQQNSFDNQTEYYTKMLTASPNYLFQGIYSDAGISGGKEDRPGFQAMMEAARKGDLDIIYTKSLSRFSRNAVLLLRSIRELQALGVEVVFEKEKLRTMSVQGELAMTILATIAEEERKSISQNVKWSIRKHYSQVRGKQPEAGDLPEQPRDSFL